MSLAYIHYMSRVDSMNFNNWKSPCYTYATVECYSRQTFWLLHFTGYPAWLQRSAKSATAVQKHSQSPPLSHLFNRIHPHFTGFFSYVRKFNPHYFLGSLFKQSKINVQNDPWKKKTQIIFIRIVNRIPLGRFVIISFYAQNITSYKDSHFKINSVNVHSLSLNQVNR